MTVTRWFKIDPSCRKDHDVPEDKGDLIVGMRHEEGCELRRVHWHADGETMIGTNTEPVPCADCRARPGDGHFEMWARTDPLPVDPDKDQDFEHLARILNKLSERGLITGVYPPEINTMRREAGVEELPARKLYDENEARAIERVATARGMAIGWRIGPGSSAQDANHVIDRIAEMLTKALEELVTR